MKAHKKVAPAKKPVGKSKVTKPAPKSKAAKPGPFWMKAAKDNGDY
jgi:hypothetical protein